VLRDMRQPGMRFVVQGRGAAARLCSVPGLGVFLSYTQRIDIDNGRCAFLVNVVSVLHCYRVTVVSSHEAETRAWAGRYQSSKPRIAISTQMLGPLQKQAFSPVLRHASAISPRCNFTSSNIHTGDDSKDGIHHAGRHSKTISRVRTDIEGENYDRRRHKLQYPPHVNHMIC